MEPKPIEYFEYHAILNTFDYKTRVILCRKNKAILAAVPDKAKALELIKDRDRWMRQQGTFVDIKEGLLASHWGDPEGM